LTQVLAEVVLGGLELLLRPDGDHGRRKRSAEPTRFALPGPGLDETIARSGWRRDDGSVDVCGGKIRIYSPQNLNLTYAYTRTFGHTPMISSNLLKNHHAELGYAFPGKSKFLSPFEKLIPVKDKYLKIIRDINFSAAGSSKVGEALHPDMRGNRTNSRCRLLLARSIKPHWQRLSKLSTSGIAKATAMITAANRCRS
jgi:hypothetical protein